MATESVQAKTAWRLAKAQHWAVSDQQLRDLGFSEGAIRHRLGTGRLHRVWPGVYAVARRDLTPLGWWMAAVLTCGEGAALSHESAAQLWRIRPRRAHRIEVTVPHARNPRRQGIRVHRRDLDPLEVTTRTGIRATIPLIAILDLAPRLERNELEAVIGDADKHGVMDPERLRESLPPSRRGPAERGPPPRSRARRGGPDHPPLQPCPDPLRPQHVETTLAAVAKRVLTALRALP